VFKISAASWSIAASSSLEHVTEPSAPHEAQHAFSMEGVHVNLLHWLVRSMHAFDQSPELLLISQVSQDAPQFALCP
jgi:hypothetical protein